MSLIGGVVLAAGLSTRMGQPKQLLPWGNRSMVRHVVDTLIAGGVEARALVVVVGYQREDVAAALEGSPAQTVFNAQYADGSMLRSLQVGLAALGALEHAATGSLTVAAALVALGDQPQLKAEVAQAVIARWKSAGGEVVAPSYRRRRGHPILFARSIWTEILAAPPVGSPRDLLNDESKRITYLEVKDDSVLRDIDTPEDYQQELRRRV